VGGQLVEDDAEAAADRRRVGTNRTAELVGRERVDIAA